MFSRFAEGLFELLAFSLWSKRKFRIFLLKYILVMVADRRWSKAHLVWSHWFIKWIELFWCGSDHDPRLHLLIVRNVHQRVWMKNHFRTFFFRLTHNLIHTSYRISFLFRSCVCFGSSCNFRSVCDCSFLLSRRFQVLLDVQRSMRIIFTRGRV